MNQIRCVLCKLNNVLPSVAVCAHCRTGVGHEKVDEILFGLQQYRLVAGRRLTDSKRFEEALRAAADAQNLNALNMIAGPMAVRIIGQRTRIQGGPLAAWRIVDHALRDKVWPISSTNLQSLSVTLVEGGNLITVVEARALLPDELSGTGGVSKP